MDVLRRVWEYTIMVYRGQMKIPFRYMEVKPPCIGNKEVNTPPPIPTLFPRQPVFFGQLRIPPWGVGGGVHLYPLAKIARSKPRPSALFYGIVRKGRVDHHRSRVMTDNIAGSQKHGSSLRSPYLKVHTPGGQGRLVQLVAYRQGAYAHGGGATSFLDL